MPRPSTTTHTRSRSRSSGTRVSTPMVCTASPTASPPLKAMQAEPPHCGDRDGQQLRLRDKGLLKEKDDNLTGEDIREGLTAIISAASASRSSKVRPSRSSAMFRCVRWLRKSPTKRWRSGSRAPAEGKAIVMKSHQRRPSSCRAADARKAIRSKSLLDGPMPDKLKDCSARARASEFSSSRVTLRGFDVRRDPETQRFCRSEARS